MVKIEWKELAEDNTEFPQPLTIEERIQAAEEALIVLLLE